MFELSVALKYLLPRWRQLSASIISLISILVIALVVWLIVVFFSVVNGLEKSWVHKLIALTAPVRVTPTDDYYNSYYYRIDTISAASDYAAKSLAEKLNSPLADPYDPHTDEEVPKTWIPSDRNPDNSLKDLAKLAKKGILSVSAVPSLIVRDYEMTTGNLRLRLIRDSDDELLIPLLEPAKNQAFLSQTTYLGSFDSDNPALSLSLLPPTMDDLTNLYSMIGISSDDIQEESPDSFKREKGEKVAERLKSFFHFVTIRELVSSPAGWVLPEALYPKEARFRAIAEEQNGRILRLVIPQELNDWVALENKLQAAHYKTRVVKLDFSGGKIVATFRDGTAKEISRRTPIIIDGPLTLEAALEESSVEKAMQPRDVHFTAKFTLQGIEIKGSVPYGNLRIKTADSDLKNGGEGSFSPLWVYEKKSPSGSLTFMLPSQSSIGEGILLPRSFREAGNRLGDRGFLGYFTPTASSVQEQRTPVFVAGFYDPGIIPIGGKYILANPEITSLIRGSQNQEDKMLSNGFNVRFDNLAQAEFVKSAIQKAFKKEGIARYWHVEAYKEFEFTKDLIQQLGSERNLFTLISIVIIVVACSNIISMLIILVNDKKLEIGILRSMGATSFGIALIFGVCGMVMGLLGSVIGTIGAIITLNNLQSLVGWISWFQGYEMFNPLFYGEALPAEMSYEALGFVLVSTVLISLIAGVIPAVKASLLKPSAILRSE